jgi:hypothetical protein
MEDLGRGTRLAPAPASRRAFLKRVGGFALAGLGVSLIPAKSAFAGGATCCKSNCRSDCSTQCQGCIAYTCTDSCAHTTCCVCSPPIANNCITTGCVC